MQGFHEKGQICHVSENKLMVVLLIDEIDIAFCLLQYLHGKILTCLMHPDKWKKPKNVQLRIILLKLTSDDVQTLNTVCTCQTKPIQHHQALIHQHAWHSQTANTRAYPLTLT